MGHIYGLHDQFMARSLITLSLLTMNQNICFVLVAGNMTGCCSVELDLIFTPVDKSALCQCLNTRFAPVSVLGGDVSLGCGMSLTDTMG